MQALTTAPPLSPQVLQHAAACAASAAARAESAEEHRRAAEDVLQHERVKMEGLLEQQQLQLAQERQV
jgi:hypothetical protein